MTVPRVDRPSDDALPSRAVARLYDVDVTRSWIGFRVRFLGLSDVRGRFHIAGGSVRLTSGDALDSVEVTVDVRSVDTGLRIRDHHLRSADYLDVERHPTASFRSERATAAPGGARLAGTITIHGRAAPLECTVVQIAGSPAERTRLAAEATFVLQRDAFGVRPSSIAVDPRQIAIGQSVVMRAYVEVVAREGS